MLTSPAWLTRRSSSGARTRTADWAAPRRARPAWPAPLPALRARSATSRSRQLGRGTGAAARRRLRRAGTRPAPRRGVVDGSVALARLGRRRRAAAPAAPSVGARGTRRDGERRRAVPAGRGVTGRRDRRGDRVGIGLRVAAAQRLEGVRSSRRRGLQRLDVGGIGRRIAAEQVFDRGFRGGAPSRPGASRRPGARRP